MWGSKLNSIENMQPTQRLHDLLAIRSVNPMGQPFSGDQPVERGVIEYIECWFASLPVSLERQLVSEAHENLLIKVEGESSEPITLFECHMDTVPADDWLETAFSPRQEGNRIIGRGACDDKGPLLAMLLAIEQSLQNGSRPAQPLWMLCAVDEEYGQTGIRHFMAGCDRQIARAVVAEPTSNVPVVQHQGTIRWDIHVAGRSAHSATAELGHNAIVDATKVIERLNRHQEDLRRRHQSPLINGPSLTVTTIHGGRTRNAVPDHCVMSLDFRVLPGMDPHQASAEVKQVVDGLGLETTHDDFQCFARPLSTKIDDPFALRLLDVCRDAHQRPDLELAGVPYGSDASCLPEGVSTMVIGPGDISHAHAIDEFVEMDAVLMCAEILGRVLPS